MKTKEKTGKHRRLKRLLIIIAAVVLIIIVGTTILNFTSGKKLEKALKQIKDAGEPVTFAEMVPPHIPDKENAAISIEIVGLLLRQQHHIIEEIVYGESKKILKELCENPHDTKIRQQSSGALSGLIEQSQEIFHYIDRATDLNKCWFETKYNTENPFEILLPHLQTLRECARHLLSTKALFLASTDKPDQALDVIRQMLILSNYPKDAPPFLINSLVQIAIHASAVDCLEKVLALSTPSPDKCLELEAEIVRSKNAVDMTFAFMGERAAIIVTLDGVRSSKLRPSRILPAIETTGGRDISVTWLLINSIVPGLPAWYLDNLAPDFVFNYDELRYLDIMNRIVQYSRMTYLEGKEKFRTIDNEIRDVSKTYQFARAMLPGITRVAERKADGGASLGSAEIALRLLIHHAEHGRYPQTLEELGEDIPLDPFTGKNFI